MREQKVALLLRPTVAGLLADEVFGARMTIETMCMANIARFASLLYALLRLTGRLLAGKLPYISEWCQSKPLSHMWSKLRYWCWLPAWAAVCCDFSRCSIPVLRSAAGRDFLFLSFFFLFGLFRKMCGKYGGHTLTQVLVRSLHTHVLDMNVISFQVLNICLRYSFSIQLGILKKELSVYRWCSLIHTWS